MRLIERRHEHAGSNRSHGLGECRLRIVEERELGHEAFLREALDLLQHAQGGHLQAMLHVGGGVDRIRQAIEQECEERGNDEGDDRGDRHDLLPVRRKWGRRRRGRVNHARNRGLKVPRGIGLLQAVHEHVVQVPVLRHFALQDTELELLAVDSLDIRLALRQRALDRRFIRTSLLILFRQASHDNINLLAGVFPRAFDLRLRLDEPRVLRTVSLRGIAQAALGLRFRHLHLLH